jgi:methyl-accepting chemotaxis protein
MQGFVEGHRASGERYRKALDAFKAAGFDATVGDKAVEGIDRLPTQTLAEASNKAEENGMRAVTKAVKSGESVYRWAIVALVVAMVLTLVGIWLYVRKAVLEPLRSGARVAERIAEGDLTAVIRSHSNDEAGQLMASLARMNEGLTRVVSQVRSAAQSVVTASSQVSAGTTDLSQRTEEQASSLEETAASMEELASTVKQNADNAKEADVLARSASKRAEQGGHEVVHVVLTMGEISDSAKRIADIISVIDGIAFQTNILALNAAVEAARAGEQGRGFAVVASEVRSLAQRSAQAAKEIKDLIGASVAKVETGTRLVEQAGDTIQALVIDVKRVSELMGSIAEASAEQARGVSQVNKTVTEMDRVVQQNAAAVQESATAAESMRRNAETLVRAVGTFQLTVEERIGGEDADEDALNHARTPAPRETALALAKTPARPAVPAKAAAHGDDWEEF